MSMMNVPDVEERRSRVASMYLRGEPIDVICRLTGSARQHITNDLAVLRQRWLASSLQDFSAAKAQEVAKIDQVEAEAWAAWQRSCEERTEAVAESHRAGKSDRTVTRKKVIQGEGNPAYLATVLNCIERRCKLFGLDSPTRHIMEQKQTLQVAVTEAAEREGLDKAEMLRLAEEYLKANAGG